MIINDEPTQAFTLLSHAARLRGVKRAWVYCLIQHGKDQGLRVWQPEAHNGGTLYVIQEKFDQWLWRRVQESLKRGHGLCGSGYRPTVGVDNMVVFRAWVHTIWEAQLGHLDPINPTEPQLRIVGGTHV